MPIVGFEHVRNFHHAATIGASTSESGTLTGACWVSIPAHICKLKGWGKSQELYFDIDQRTGKVVLDKLEEAAKTETQNI